MTNDKLTDPVLAARGARRVRLQNVIGNHVERSHDFVAVEEPLEIRIQVHRAGEIIDQSLSITMRTPGRDLELAAGFLFSEGVVQKTSDIEAIDHVRKDDSQECNIVCVWLSENADFDVERFKRHIYTTSSCGVCGKASLEMLYARNLRPVEAGPQVSSAVIHGLGSHLQKAQSVFEKTGGLHAAALFSAAGELLDLCEDVGRHNAVDKIIGRYLLSGRMPLSNKILMVSGRTSFEIVQKCVAAGVPILAAVGAPSSLAIETAAEFGLTLLGFVRDNRFNIYSGRQRMTNDK